jgi:hypothetical protein
MTDRIKRTNVNGLLLLVIMAMACWVAVQPESQAQLQYGPNVISDLKRFDVVVKTATTHDIITGVDGKRFRIISLFVRSNSSTANNIYFAEEGNTDTAFGTNSTDVETLDQLSISGKAGWVAPPNDGGWYETETAGTDFEITLSAAQAVSVVGTYVEIR